MNATTLRQVEAKPNAYPTVEGLSERAAETDAEWVWRRIESYIAHRWTPRTVTWLVEGPGDWTPPLTPAVLVTASAWAGSGRGDPFEVTPQPLGVSFDAGRYQITATVGGTDDALPGDVAEAFRRLAEYVSAEDAIGVPGASRYSIDMGPITETISRRDDHMARALINSGAADLLRPYRRA